MSVGELIEMLKGVDPALPVLANSLLWGVGPDVIVCRERILKEKEVRSRGSKGRVRYRAAKGLKKQAVGRERGDPFDAIIIIAETPE